ncbi:MAG: hypothetical protein PHC51_07395 [bacterium]|nr:hypothetical protein [bacterium]
MKKIKSKKHGAESRERGSLSLEHVLFIGAIAGISTGIITFYDGIEKYITATAESFAEAPTNLGATQ